MTKFLIIFTRRIQVLFVISSIVMIYCRNMKYYKFKFIQFHNLIYIYIIRTINKYAKYHRIEDTKNILIQIKIKNK